MRTNGRSACNNTGAVKKAGDTMTGNLFIQGSLHPSVYLLPAYGNATCRGVIKGGYPGGAFFSVLEDAGRSNRRMIGVRPATYVPSMDHVILLRTAINGSYCAYRIFHAGMATPIPITNGGAGASAARAVRSNLGIFYSATLPESGADGQICLVLVC